jgi:hypothetical protein
MMTSSAFASLALSLGISPAHVAAAFSGAFTIPCYVLSTTLNYQSLYHSPDVDPSSKIERDSTKMDKDKIHQYGPGHFAQYIDHDSSNLFDGGDSKMGLAGNRNHGLRRIGHVISPHMARALTAKVDQAVALSSYVDELLSDLGINAARAQQLENRAMQNEIAMANRYTYLNDRTQDYQGHYTTEYDGTGEVSMRHTRKPCFTLLEITTKLC